MWLAIPGFDGYEASEAGLIRSLGHACKRGTNGIEFKEGRTLKPGHRYRRGKLVCMTVNLSIAGVKHTERVHRLVLLAFVGPCPEGMEGCHNDGNPSNNVLSNLRWDTHLANCADSKKHGTASPPPIHRGAGHHNTTLCEADIHEIRGHEDVRGLHARLGRVYLVSGQTIRRIRAREVWAHI